MKKLFSLLLIFMMTVLLSSCSTQEEKNTPVLPSSFNQRAKVSAGDFSYQCEICKKEEKLILTVLSTNAQGLVMTYDGSNMNFSFSEIVGDAPAVSLPKQNAVIVLYDALRSLEEQEGLVPSVVNEGYRYQGKTALGNFVLLTDKNGSLKAFTMKSIDMEIQFVN